MTMTMKNRLLPVTTKVHLAVAVKCLTIDLLYA